MSSFFSSACFLFLVFVRAAWGQTCVFTDTRCTCSFGSSAGACYEPTGTIDGVQVCARRNCDPGWKCDCEGDYFCDVADIDVYTLIDQNDNLLTTDVPCQVITQQTVTSSGFKLGYFQPQFSDKGLLDQQCQTFAWFLDGVLQDSFDTLTAVSNTNLETVKTSLGDWNLLPLRSGSVIGFRWKDEDYYCYNSISNLSINGTETDSRDTTLVTHRFSNIFEEDWFASDFVEGSSWSDPKTTSFGDSFDADNVTLTNTYWRIKVL